MLGDPARETRESVALEALSSFIMADLENRLSRAASEHVGQAKPSHCPEHKWASARDDVEKKSIFYPLSEQDEASTEGDTSPSQSRPPSQPTNEGSLVRMASVPGSLSTCGPSGSEQVGALDLQVRSKLGSELPKITLEKTDEGRGREEAPSSNEAGGEAAAGGEQAQQEGGEADPAKTLPEGQSQVAPDSDSDLAQTSSCKVKSGGLLTGHVGKWKKDPKSRTRDILCPDGPPPLASGESEKPSCQLGEGLA
ncbi:uncharacterized protein LOC131187003 [Ahaetulla prasina]|uniref:uncharacterized protein LOC131187003 n=1 Tax=Ahaetulla prasina TaxID=499056 RepID=UPI00264A21D4|nr:uncharacterized protein LOC131187003 [Ahaetulla prasina]